MALMKNTLSQAGLRVSYTGSLHIFNTALQSVRPLLLSSLVLQSVCRKHVNTEMNNLVAEQSTSSCKVAACACLACANIIS